MQREQTGVRWTPRQRQVLDLIAAGHTNPEIAERLGISLDGAKWHVSEVISKLGVRTREDAAEYWARERRGGVGGWLRRASVPIALAGGGAALAVATIAVVLSLTGGGDDEPISPPADASPDPAGNPDPTPGPPATPQASGTFALVGDMAVPRSIHAAATLHDGRVLIMGGSTGGNAPPVTGTTEIFDPATRTFSPGPDLLEARQTFAAVTLADGRVLVTGGVPPSGPNLRSAEIYDPGANSFSATGAMIEPRIFHAMGLLPDGRVLVVGSASRTGLASTELFDPVTNTFSRGPDANRPKQATRMVTLADGSLNVVSGGIAERYDPASGTFVLVNDSGTLPEVPTVLPDGRVLLTGGLDYQFASTAPTITPGAGHGVPVPATGAAMVLDPMTGAVTDAGQMTTSRLFHQAIALPDGTALVAGGVSDTQFGEFIASAEIYDVATGTFTAVESMADGRVWFTLSLLENGEVLVVGVNREPGNFAAEVYAP